MRSGRMYYLTMVDKIKVEDIFQTYCYFYVNEADGHAFLIDPGAQGDMLLDTANKKNYTIEAIVLTHGHFDHFGGVDFIRSRLNIPVYAHERADEYLLNPYMNLSRFYTDDMIVTETIKIKDGDSIKLNSADHFGLRVLYTPGHTTDSVTLKSLSENVAFVGDTIFKGRSGYSGYPGGNRELLNDSIYNKILALPDDTLLYSGHSMVTSVSKEKSFRP